MRIFWGVAVVFLAIIGTQTDMDWWPGKIVVCLIAGFCIHMAQKARLAQLKTIQVERDGAAITVTTNVLNLVPRQFVLFLRPFSITRKLPVRNPYNSFGFLWPGAVGEPYEIDLESLLSNAFSSANPLIGLGKPGEAIGAGRLETSDSDWQVEFKKLVFVAQVILVVPAISSGVRWEIDFLKEHDLLTKCIFVMPPGLGEGFAETWQCSIGQLPIEMPPYSSKGMLYSVDSSGRLHTKANLAVKTTRALAARFREVLEDAQRDDMVTYKLSDQPVIRGIGWMAIYLIVVPILTILLLTLLLGFFH